MGAYLGCSSSDAFEGKTAVLASIFGILEVLSSLQNSALFGNDGALFSFLIGWVSMMWSLRWKELAMGRRSKSLFVLRGGILALVCAAVVVTGCQKTALRPKDTRSQYDRYDQARNQRAEPFSEDEFGKRTPNLRGRLIVREN